MAFVTFLNTRNVAGVGTAVELHRFHRIQQLFVRQMDVPIFDRNV